MVMVNLTESWWVPDIDYIDGYKKITTQKDFKLYVLTVIRVEL